MNRNVRKRTFWHEHLAKILETEENIFALTRTILRNPFSHVAANMWPYLPVFGRLSYHTCSKIRTSTIHHPILCLKIAGLVANRVDPDETPRTAASHLSLLFFSHLVYTVCLSKCILRY